MRADSLLRAAPVVLLLPSLVLGACDDPIPAEAATLLATREEPAGANCARGGSAISAGRDVNGDGVLAEAEIESTVYACRPPPPTRATDTLAGSVSVWNQDDVDALAGVKTITGDLLIEADRMETLRFPDLLVVGGGIRFEGATAIDVVEFPELVTVGQISGAKTALREIWFPKLSTIWDDAVLAADSAIAMPALTSVETLRFTVGTRDGDARVSLTSLTTVERLSLVLDGVAVALDAPVLATVTDRDGKTPPPLYVRIPTTASLTFPALASTGTADLSGGSFTFPVLDEVDGVLKVSADVLLMPSLTSVTSSFRPTVNTTFTVPMLTTVGTLDLGYSLNESMQFPALTTVTGVCSGVSLPCGISLSQTAIVEFELPSLTTVASGKIEFINNLALHSVSFPKLVRPSGTVPVAVERNGTLDSCAIQDAIDGWADAGWLGQRSFVNNDNDDCVE